MNVCVCFFSFSHEYKQEIFNNKNIINRFFLFVYCFYKSFLCFMSFFFLFSLERTHGTKVSGLLKNTIRSRFFLFTTSTTTTCCCCCCYSYYYYYHYYRRRRRILDGSYKSGCRRRQTNDGDLMNVYCPTIETTTLPMMMVVAENVANIENDFYYFETSSSSS